MAAEGASSGVPGDTGGGSDARVGTTASGAVSAVQGAQHFDIDEFEVQGAETLPQIEIEDAIYPFMGPNKTSDDVAKAREALEKAYHEKGYQAVSVSIPPQNVERGIVVLKVSELKVGRLRVAKSRYFDQENIKDHAQSVKEGVVPNFNGITKDIVGLNQWPDRRVTPALRAGTAPGTVDVDLNVEDKLPLHASIELNNRQSPDTTPTRLNASVRYDNLWQLGHSLSVSFQTAPERPDDAEVYSGSYLARSLGNDWLSLLAYGVKTRSDITTIGGINVLGPGEIIGARAIATLPSLDGFFHSVSVGVDYKRFDQQVRLGGDAFSSPITYFPIVANYNASWPREGALTQLNAGVTWGTRGLGSGPENFDARRAFAEANFIYVRADLAHTHDLPEGFQLYGKLQGQLADQPLVSNEQFSIGGLDTVRGYLESEAVGDNGLVGTIELRSPDIAAALQKAVGSETADAGSKEKLISEWRFFAFADAGEVNIRSPLPEQESVFELWSYGVGMNFKMFDHLNGSVVLARPNVDQDGTVAGQERVHFRVWGDF
ncbi:MAG: ShlB/FhaC/HecB family hemolysin secretion/activation protein [Hyphomicrobium sp.]